MKRQIFTRFSLLGVALTAFALTASAQDTEQQVYSAAYSSDQVDYWGTGKNENYDLAVHISDPELVGKTITGISVCMPSSITGIGEKGAAFITKTLALENKVNVADVETDSFTVQAGWQDITFSTPYTITADGVYVGYSFSLTSADAEAPVATVAKTAEGFMYLHTARTYRKWTDKSSTLGMALNMKVYIQTSTMNAATISCEGLEAEVGDQPVVYPVLRNTGAKGIQSIDYTLEFQGETITAHRDLTSPVSGQFGATTTFPVTLPVIEQAGTQQAVFTLNKVNGVDNEAADNSCSAEIVVYQFIPVKRPLCEEYTGTWCGWCPRGFVGMENLYKAYGDDFCGIAYHNGDPMEFTSDFSNSIDGFPSFIIDRTYSTDSYVGDSKEGRFHTDEVYERFAKEMSPVAVYAKAYFTDDNTIKVETELNAASDITNNDRYQMQYVLTADSLTGTGSSWDQANYYPGYASSYPEDDMKQFTEGSGTVSGLVYNFVGVARSGKYGISNSLPTQLAFNTPITVEYTFNIASNSIIQHKDKLHVIAIVLDTQNSNAAVNASKAYVYTSEALGINNVDAKDATPVAYYTLDGKQISKPVKGLNVVRLSNGQVKKMLVK